MPQFLSSDLPLCLAFPLIREGLDSQCCPAKDIHDTCFNSVNRVRDLYFQLLRTVCFPVDLWSKRDVRWPYINEKRKIACEQAVWGTLGMREREKTRPLLFLFRALKPMPHKSEISHMRRVFESYCKEARLKFKSPNSYYSRPTESNFFSRNDDSQCSVPMRSTVITTGQCIMNLTRDWLLAGYTDFATYHLPSRSDWTSISTNTRKSLIKY